MTPDIINALFEGIGGLLIWVNVYRLYKDKRVSGVSLAPTAFFTVWGLWNLYFYPTLGAWWSFLGGISIVTANTVWWFQMIYYTTKEKSSEKAYTETL